MCRDTSSCNQWKNTLKFPNILLVAQIPIKAGNSLFALRVHHDYLQQFFVLWLVQTFDVFCRSIKKILQQFIGIILNKSQCIFISDFPDFLQLFINLNQLPPLQLILEIQLCAFFKQFLSLRSRIASYAVRSFESSEVF